MRHGVGEQLDRAQPGFRGQRLVGDDQLVGVGRLSEGGDVLADLERCPDSGERKRLLDKLALTSRTQIATWGLSQGLGPSP